MRHDVARPEESSQAQELEGKPVESTGSGGAYPCEQARGASRPKSQHRTKKLAVSLQVKVRKKNCILRVCRVSGSKAMLLYSNIFSSLSFGVKARTARAKELVLR